MKAWLSGAGFPVVTREAVAIIPAFPFWPLEDARCCWTMAPSVSRANTSDLAFLKLLILDSGVQPLVFLSL